MLIVSVINSLSHGDIQCLINSSSNYKNVIISFCSLSEMFTSVSLWYFLMFLHQREQTCLWFFSCHRLGSMSLWQNFCHRCLFLTHFKMSYATKSFWSSLKCFWKGMWVLKEKRAWKYLILERDKVFLLFCFLFFIAF